MGKDESVVKSFRISEDVFDKANDVFKKEGFCFSEVVRLLCEAAIREGQIPRGLSTRDLEDKLDASQTREKYIDDILSMVGIVPESQRGMSSEDRLLNNIFLDNRSAKELSNADLRDWAASWGFPDDISIATLQELHDCGIFGGSPLDGPYDADIYPIHPCGGDANDALRDAMLIMSYENNIKDNLEQIKRQFQIRAIKYLLEMDNCD